MKDIFDIIETRKDKHIKIKGEISEYSLCYDMDVVNEFYSILLDNVEHLESTKFNIEQITPSTFIDNQGIYTPTSRQSHESIIFDIDIYVDNYLWRELSDFEDFIYYYTEGSIKYDNKYTSDLTIDRLEEYMSGRIIEDLEPVSSTIIWDEFSSVDRSLADELFNIGSRPVRSYDADGDAVFAAEFRLTDMSNMFRNASIDLSRLD